MFYGCSISLITLHDIIIHTSKRERERERESSFSARPRTNSLIHFELQKPGTPITYSCRYLRASSNTIERQVSEPLNTSLINCYLFTDSMCLTHPSSRPSIDARILTISPRISWLNSACCTSPLFFQHRESDMIICPEYYSSASGTEKRNYQGILQHYIHLDCPALNFVTCSILTVTLHALR